MILLFSKIEIIFIIHRDSMFKVIDMKRSTITIYYCSFPNIMQLYESQKLTLKKFSNFTDNFVKAKIIKMRVMN